MRVSFIRHSEPTQDDPGNPRLFRVGSMVKYFSAKAEVDEVKWYVSDFDHFNKSHRNYSCSSHYGGKLLISYISTPGYRNNLSVARLWDHFVFGVKVFRKLFKSRTDVIIVSFPTITSAFLSVVYGKLKATPVIIDFRDMWPELFWQGQSGFKAGILKLGFFPVTLMSKFALKHASVLSAPTKSYLSYAQRYGRRSPSSTERDFVSPLGYSKTSYEIDAELGEKICKNAANRKVVCFAGTVGNMFDFETIIEASKQLIETHLFVMCGSGGRLEQLASLSADNENVLWLGWVDKKMLHTIFEISDVALTPYKNIPNFTQHVPNKFGEYMSYGLPVASCLTGESEELVRISGGGFYKEGDSASLQTLLLNLLDTPQCKETKDACLSYFYEHLSSESCYGKFLQKIKDTVHN